MKKYIIPAALMAMICGLLDSCVPAPTTTLVYPSFTGHVVDEEGYAIPGATVIAERAGYVRQGQTSARGRFTLPPVTQIHYALIAGPPGVKPPPWFWQRGPLPLTLTASAPGYETATISISSRQEVPFPLVLPDRLQFQLHRTGGQAQPLP